jgi:hypothetical protein
MKTIQTEICSGEDEPGRKHVSLRAWRALLTEVVTARFPGGPSLLTA